MSVEDTIQFSYHSWINDPNNESKYQDLLALLTNKSLTTLETINKCIVHDFQDFAVGFLFGSWLLEKCDEKTLSLQNQMSLDCRKCIHCIRTIYVVKDAVLNSFGDPKISKMGQFRRDSFEKLWNEWHQSRIQISMDELIGRYEAVNNDHVGFKVFRNETLFVVFELLKYPLSLQNLLVDAKFIDLITKARRGSNLRLSDGFFPGLYLLSAHDDEATRNWANSILNTTKSKILLADDADAKLILKILIDALTAPNFQKGFNLCHEPQNILVSLNHLLYSFSKDTLLQNKFSISYYEQLAVMSKNCMNIPECVNDSVRLYTFLLTWYTVLFGSQNTSAKWILYEEIPNSILENELLISTFSSVDFANQNQLNKLNWIAHLIVGNSKNTESIAMFKKMEFFLEKIVGQNLENQNLVLLNIIFPALSRSFSKPNAFAPGFTKISSQLLKQFSAASAFESVIVDIALLDLKRIQSSCSALVKDPSYTIRHEIHEAHIWEQLLNILKNQKELPIQLIESCRLIALFDSDSSVFAQDSQLANSIAFLQEVLITKLLSTVANPQAIISKINTLILYFSSSPCQEILKVSESLLLKGTNSENGEQCLAALYKQDNLLFLNGINRLLADFSLMCTEGFMMLSCSILLVELLSIMVELVLDPREMTSSIEETIFKAKGKFFMNVLEFITFILTYTIKWAQSSRRNADVRSVVVRTLSMVEHLITRLLRAEINFELSQADDHNVMQACLESFFTWFGTIDGNIRQQATLMFVEMLRLFTNRFHWQPKDKFLNQINGYADQSIKSQLSELERSYMLLWRTQQTFSELEASMKPKTQQNNTPEITASTIKKNPNQFYSKTAASGSREVENPHFSRINNIIKTNQDPVKMKIVDISSSVLSMSHQGTRKISQSASSASSKKKQSKMQQLKSEVFMERVAMSSSTTPSSSLLNISSVPFSKKAPDSKTSTRTIEIIESDDDSLTGPGLKELANAADLSPEKPRRKIKEIDLPHVNENPLKKFKFGSDPTVVNNTRVGDIALVHKKILRWEFPAEGDRPPNFDEYYLKKIPEQFMTVNDYTAIFEPLLLLECWEHLVKAKDEVLEDDFIDVKLEHATAVDGFYDLQMKASSSEFRGKGLGENDVIQLTHKNKRVQCLAKIQNQVGNQRDVCTFVSRIYPEKLHSLVSLLVPDSCWEVLGLFSLTTMHREYTAITYLPMLSLCNEILKPNFQKYRPEERKVLETMKTFSANRPQAEAIVSAVHQKSGFVLIQGPPGTGKTKTIMSLIGCMLTKPSGKMIQLPTSNRPPIIQSRFGNMKNNNKPTDKSTPKLMCCAPSNAACDEIVRRLKQGIIDANGEKFYPKVVRLGTSDAIHADVKDVTLELLVEESFTSGADYQILLKRSSSTDELEGKLKEKLNSLNKEKDELQQRQSKVDPSDAQALLDLDTQMRMVNQKRKDVLEQLTAQRDKKNENSKALDMAKKVARARVLNDADVVCCTLSAAGHEILSNVNIEFPTVIIDEACQCIELSCLIPLKYGTKKCILVGDPNQLPPTVLSQLGQKFQYEQSLFQRIMKCVPDTVHLLSIQYRMHPDIAALPSLLFYESKLLNGPDLELKCQAQWHKKHLFSPYRFFDVHRGKEVRRTGGRSVYNPEEIEACLTILDILCSRHTKINFAYRVGIITPYKLQVKKLREKLVQRFGPKILNVIDVNTVDGFQGQEKDIIILSCVRGGEEKKGIGFLSDVRRMNVALTRAKCSLFVLGNAQALRRNGTWKTLVEDAEKRNMFTPYSSDLFLPANSKIDDLPVPSNLSP